MPLDFVSLGFARDRRDKRAAESRVLPRRPTGALTPREENMKCFNHQDRDAVGLCKNCHKALCTGCLVETSAGISCRGPCEQEVAVLGSLMQRAVGTHRKTSRAYQRTAIVFGLMGLVFAAVGVMEEMTWVLVMGVVCAIGAGFYYLTSKEFRKD